MPERLLTAYSGLSEPEHHGKDLPQDYGKRNTVQVRGLIYTTNAIKGFNRQMRKVTKAKSIFPTDDSLLKMLYLAMMDITKEWRERRQDWILIHTQLAIYFACRSHARVTPLWPDVKGKMNGFAVLDIHPHRRYAANKAAAG